MYNIYSHAINAYLVGKYAKDDKLYPKDFKARSVVDHRLYFDCGTLFQCVRAVAVSRYFINFIIPQSGVTLIIFRFVHYFAARASPREVTTVVFVK